MINLQLICFLLGHFRMIYIASSLKSVKLANLAIISQNLLLLLLLFNFKVKYAFKMCAYK